MLTGCERKSEHRRSSIAHKQSGRRQIHRQKAERRRCNNDGRADESCRGWSSGIRASRKTAIVASAVPPMIAADAATPSTPSMKLNRFTDQMTTQSGYSHNCRQSAFTPSGYHQHRRQGRHRRAQRRRSVTQSSHAETIHIKVSAKGICHCGMSTTAPNRTPAAMPRPPPRATGRP